MLRRRTTIFSEAKPERLSEPERDRAEARRGGGEPSYVKTANPEPHSSAEIPPRKLGLSVEMASALPFIPFFP